MTQPVKVQEPSMEEILSSIRRIIADDETKPSPAVPAKAAPRDLKPELPNAAAAPRPPKAIERPAPVQTRAFPEPVEKRVDTASPAIADNGHQSASNNQADIDALLADFEPATPAAADAESDVFELTEDMAIQTDAPAARASEPEPDNDIEFSEIRSDATPSILATAAEPAQSSVREAITRTQPMLSASTAAAVESAFSSLAATVLSNNARTLEDLVQEMLRPMLKSWLDDNLPTLVERVVRAEIERVSRGSR